MHPYALSGTTGATGTFRVVPSGELHGGWARGWMDGCTCTFMHVLMEASAHVHACAHVVCVCNIHACKCVCVHVCVCVVCVMVV